MNDTLPVQYDGLVGGSWIYADEMARLKELVPFRGAFLEVGSAEGVTAAEIARVHFHCQVVCLDPYLVDRKVTVPVDGGFAEFVESNERLARWRQNRQGNMNLWMGRMASFHAVCGMRFDVILVDGDHRFDDVYSDLMYAGCLIKPEGIIAAHDYSDAWAQPKAAIDRFCGDHGWEKSEVVRSMAVLRKRK